MEHQEQSRYGVANFEKRKHPRFDIDLPVEYWRTEEEVKKGRVLNAGEGGLLLYLPELMKIGQSFALRVMFSSADRIESIEVLVQVVWIDIPPRGRLGRISDWCQIFGYLHRRLG